MPTAHVNIFSLCYIIRMKLWPHSDYKGWHKIRVIIFLFGVEIFSVCARSICPLSYICTPHIYTHAHKWTHTPNTHHIPPTYHNRYHHNPTHILYTCTYTYVHAHTLYISSPCPMHTHTRHVCTHHTFSTHIYMCVHTHTTYMYMDLCENNCSWMGKISGET